MISMVVAFIAARQHWRFVDLPMPGTLDEMHAAVRRLGGCRGEVKVAMLDASFRVSFSVSKGGRYRVEGSGFLYVGNEHGYYVYDQAEQRCIRAVQAPDLLQFAPGFEALLTNSPTYEASDRPQRVVFEHKSALKFSVRSGAKRMTLFVDPTSWIPLGWESRTANATVRGVYILSKTGPIPDSVFSWIPPPGAMVGSQSRTNEP